MNNSFYKACQDNKYGKHVSSDIAAHKKYCAMYCGGNLYQHLVGDRLCHLHPICCDLDSGCSKDYFDN